MLRILRDIGGFLWQRKRFWLIPIILALAVVGILVLVAESSPLSPFIYTLF